MDEDRRFYVYVKIMEVILKDKTLSFDEYSLLQTIKEGFDNPDEAFEKAMNHLQGKEQIDFSEDLLKTITESPEPEADMAFYEAMLTTALEDETISADELSILNRVRHVLNITDEQHTACEDRLREKMQHNPSAIERLGNLSKALATGTTGAVGAVGGAGVKVVAGGVDLGVKSVKGTAKGAAKVATGSVKLVGKTLGAVASPLTGRRRTSTSNTSEDE